MGGGCPRMDRESHASHLASIDPPRTIAGRARSARMGLAAAGRAILEPRAAGNNGTRPYIHGERVCAFLARLDPWIFLSRPLATISGNAGGFNELRPARSR